jgi:PAS domain S-box-containing protein
VAPSTTTGPTTAAGAPARGAARGLFIGLAAMGVLTVAKLALLSGLGESAPFLLYFWPVLLAAWYGGVRAGVATTFAAALLGAYLSMPMPPAGGVLGPKALAQVALFGGEGVVLTLVIARILAERRRAAGAAAEARLALDKLNVVLSGVDEGITVQDGSGRLVYANELAARLSGFASPDELLRAAPDSLAERIQLLGEDERPISRAALPGRVLFGGGTPQEKLVCWRDPEGGEQRWAVLRANAVRDEDGRILFAVNLIREVTEKRRQEQTIRLNQEWFSTAMHTLGDAVITATRDGQIMFMNPAAGELTGWPPAQAIGQPLMQIYTLVDESSGQALESPLARVLREGGSRGLAPPTLLVRRDKSAVAIDHSIAPIRSESGELAGVVLVFRDVSVKRREAQRQSFLVRATQELNSSLDYQTTLATVARLAVPAIADWCAVDMLEGGEIRRLAVAHVDPETIQRVAEIERRYPTDKNATSGVPNALRTGQPEMVADIPPAMIDAAARDAEHLRLIRLLALRSYVAVPIKHGGKIIGAITFAMAESQRVYEPEDLALATALADRAAVAVENARLFTAVEKARAQIAAQRDRLYDLVMASPMAIALLRGPELTYELVNEPFEKIFGGRKLQGRKVADLDPTGKHSQVLWRVRDTGVPFTATDRELQLDRDGSGQLSTCYFTYAIVPMRDDSGQVDGVMSFTLEVTEQVMARRKVEEARLQAELANRSKDEFLAMLGHELRNPLAPILTTLQLMQLQGGTAFLRERNIIERQVKHVVRLVDDLLDISRITGGKVELALEPLGVAELVATAIEMASPLLERRQHHLQVAVAPGLRVQGDPVRLAQVLANVLNNAAKYTQDGGHIEIRGERDGDAVVLTVRDDGMGIAREMLPRVFDLFAQETQALDRSQGGLGLGLAIVRSLVSLHGGTVSAHSEGLGKGSLFTIRLPALTEAPQTSARSPRLMPGAATEDALLVLVVDDNADALELLAETLEVVGYRTLRATDGPAALALVAKARPAIALLDIGLPAMDGYELARRLHATPGLEQLKLIAVTGYGQPSDRERSAAAGFAEHLVKPVSLPTVQAAIERLRPRATA